MSWGLSNCCLCLPLRVGLLIYGYSALVITYLSIFHKLCQLDDYLDGSNFNDSYKFIDLSLTFAIFIIHFIFHIVLIAGLHRTCRGMLEVFYGYQVILVIGEVALASLYLPLQLYKNYETLKYTIWIPVVTAISVFLLVLMQIYLITGVRSFITVLDDRKEETYQPAVNSSEDTGCTLQFYNRGKDYCEECDHC